MTGPGRQRCRFCGTALATPTDPMCGSCARAAGFRKPIPDGFYEDADLRAAPARYDFGAVFAAVRQHTGLSQPQLADLLDLSQSRISAVERGERRLTHVKLAARLATLLHIPPRLLGFPVETGGSVAAQEEVSWLERRDFLALVTAATLGSSLHPELARLGSLLPDQVEPVTRPRIGAADADDHDAARRLWTYALDTARRAEDNPRAPDLAVDVLLDMAHQALHLYGLDPVKHADRAGEAPHLVQLASATAANRRHPVSTITQGYISAVLGWCRAALGEPEPTRRAIGNAQDTYAAADPATAPPWVWFLTDAEITPRSPTCASTSAGRWPARRRSRRWPCPTARTPACPRCGRRAGSSAPTPPRPGCGILLLSVHSSRREIALRTALRHALAGHDPGFVIATAAPDHGHGDGPAGRIWSLWTPQSGDTVPRRYRFGRTAPTRSTRRAQRLEHRPGTQRSGVRPEQPRDATPHQHTTARTSRPGELCGRQHRRGRRP